MHAWLSCSHSGKRPDSSTISVSVDSMHVRQFCISLLCIVVVAAVTAAIGCSAPRNPWRFSDPPAASGSSRLASAIDTRRPTIVIGHFEDPSRAPGYAAGSGKSIGQALARSLLSSDTYNVIIRADVRSLADQRLTPPTDATAEQSGENDVVHYLITGKVTDFYHTTDLPEEASRWGVLGRRREAIVAVELRVVDVRTQRVLMVDQFNATASAGRGSGTEIYDQVALDAYLFWSTPLGRAARISVEEGAERVEHVLPRRLNLPRIVRRDDLRRVTIDGGEQDGMRSGQKLFLVERSPDGRQWQPINDPDTGMPLQIRLIRVGQRESVGWVYGRPDDSTRLRGLTVMERLPTSDDSVEAAAADATDLPE